MDCFPFGNQALLLPLFLGVFQIAGGIPFGNQLHGPRSGHMHSSASMFQPAIPFQPPQLVNSWNGPAYVTNNGFNNLGGLPPNNPVYPIGRQVVYRPFYKDVMNFNNQPTSNDLPQVITKQQQQQQKISVLSGPLFNVMPHPRPRMLSDMSAKKRNRVQNVATAKSFPGILKDTSLDVTHVRPL